MSREDLPEKAQPSRVIAIERLPLNYEDLQPYLAEGCTLHLEAGPSGYLLHSPISIILKPGTSRGELDIVNYVATSLSAYSSQMTPWVLGSPAMMMLATYLRRYRSSSPWTLCIYVNQVKQFCEWIGRAPGALVSSALREDGLPDPRGVKILQRSLKEYVGELQARGLAPSTVTGAVKAIQTMLRANEVEIPRTLTPQRRNVYEDRAPKPEELARMMEIADLRGRVIISMLALGGFRIGTLGRLRYRHVKEDLERGVVPVHVHVEAAITKGGYGSYDTFLGAEAVEALRLYLDQRRRGSPCEKIPPENLERESPLIRRKEDREVRAVSRRQLHAAVRDIYTMAGLSDERSGRMHTLRPHSIRKFFRTQLAALGVPPDYIEYMMGHRVSTYHDIKMKGVEFLRNLYAASGLSIRPRTQVSRLEMLKEVIRAWGLDPEKILVRDALQEPHRVVVALPDREENQVKALAGALKEMLRKEVLDSGHPST